MAGPSQKELEVLISELEVRMERLRKLYDQYFLGFEKLEPLVARKDVDRRVEVLRKEQLRNTALRFRFQMSTQKYSTYQTLWARTCRAIEDGTYKRHLQKAKARFGTPGAPEPDLGIDVDLEDFENLEEEVAADIKAMENGAAPAERVAAAAAALPDDNSDTDRPPPGSEWRPTFDDDDVGGMKIPASPPMPRAFHPAAQRPDGPPPSRLIVRRAPPGLDARPADGRTADPPPPPSGLDLSDPFELDPVKKPAPAALRPTPGARPMIRPRNPADPTPAPRRSPVAAEPTPGPMRAPMPRPGAAEPTPGPMRAPMPRPGAAEPTPGPMRAPMPRPGAAEPTPGPMRAPMPRPGAAEPTPGPMRAPMPRPGAAEPTPGPMRAPMPRPGAAEPTPGPMRAPMPRPGAAEPTPGPMRAPVPLPNDRVVRRPAPGAAVVRPPLPNSPAAAPRPQPHAVPQHPMPAPHPPPSAPRLPLPEPKKKDGDPA